MNDLVEIATFTFPNEADVLRTLLEREGISYFLKNEGVSLVMPPMSTGGIALVVKTADVDKAVELIKRDGFGKYLNDEYI